MTLEQWAEALTYDVLQLEAQPDRAPRIVLAKVDKRRVLAHATTVRAQSLVE